MKRSSTKALVAVLAFTVLAAGCQSNAAAGKKCNGDGWGRDANLNVFQCEGKKWVRKLTRQQVLTMIAKINAKPTTSAPKPAAKPTPKPVAPRPTTTKAPTTTVAPTWPQLQRILTSAGQQPNNAADGITSMAISRDGSTVAFVSNANNLVPGDNNNAADVFVWRRGTPGSTPTLQRIVANDGAQPNAAAKDVSISTDGKTVAFTSTASNLVTGDSNGLSDIFVWRNGSTPALTRILAANGAQPDADAVAPSLSADGNTVAFSSAATNFVANDTNAKSDIFVASTTATPSIRRVVAEDGTTQPNGDSSAPALSADGSTVAFVSAATNLITGDNNAKSDVFVQKLTGTASLVRINGNDGRQPNGDASAPSISANGSVVAYTSAASNIVAADNNNAADVFVWTAGAGTPNERALNIDGTEANGAARTAAINADGTVVAYSSDATNIVAGDSNGTADVFVWQRNVARGITRIMGTGALQPNGHLTVPSISGDAKAVAFIGQATNITAGDTNNASDIFVLNR